MKNMMQLMKQAKEMQEKMKSLQEDMAQLEKTGRAGGGLVELVLQGKGEMKSLKIDPSLLKAEEVEILEDLVIAAHNDAKAQLEQAAAEKTQEITQALPSGLKLPF